MKKEAIPQCFEESPRLLGIIRRYRKYNVAGYGSKPLLAAKPKVTIRPDHGALTTVNNSAQAGNLPKVYT
jgi:hypothetical protein